VPAAGAGYQDAWQYGDEPVLMAYRAKSIPVWVGKDRWRSGNLAIQAGGADTLIMDDGFQHLALDRSLDIVLLDAQNPFGNGALLPLGPLREPPAHLQRADAIVLTRAEPPAESAKTRSRITSLFPGKPVFSCIHRLAGLRREIDGDCLPLTALEGKKAVAFAGIARPESFFQHLRQAGVVLSGTFAFPDHYRYLRDDMLMLVKAMRESEARFLLSTEKDFFRIPPEFQAFTLATVVEIDFLLDHEAFCGFLIERLPSR
jgi:tetraacyldisaccharide 4'-kinase